MPLPTKLPDAIELHGALTHFPIALLFMAITFDLGAYLWRKQEWRIVSFWMIVSAAIMIVPTLATGWIAGGDYTAGRGGVPAIFWWHRLSAFTTGGLAVTLLLWRVKVKDALSGTALLGSIALTLLTVSIVGYTGFLGGRMVFGTNDAAGQTTAPQPGSAIAATKPLPKFDPKLIAAGEKLFTSDDNGCLNCHRMGDKGGRKAPDLTHEGLQPHDLKWQIEHLKAPAKMRPGSPMPNYDDMKPDELRALAAYLVTRP